MDLTPVERLGNHVTKSNFVPQRTLWRTLLSLTADFSDILNTPVVIRSIPDITPELFPDLVDCLRDAFLEKRYPCPIAIAKGTLKANDYEKCPVTGEFVDRVEVSPKLITALDQLFQRMSQFDLGPLPSEIPLFTKNVAALIDLFFHLELACPQHFTFSAVPRYIDMILSLPKNTKNHSGFWMLWHLLSNVDVDGTDFYCWPHLWPLKDLKLLLPWYAEYLTEQNSDQFGPGVKINFTNFVIDDDDRAKLIDQMPPEYAEIAACLRMGIQISAVPYVRQMASQGLYERIQIEKECPYLGKETTDKYLQALSAIRDLRQRSDHGSAVRNHAPE